MIWLLRFDFGQNEVLDKRDGAFLIRNIQPEEDKINDIQVIKSYKGIEVS